MRAIVISKGLRLARVNEGSHSFTCHSHVYSHMEPGIEQYKHSLTFRVRHYVVIATKPVRTDCKNTHKSF